ncbi:MAG: hypothetical protein K2X32_05625, partial [Phycisphaerales bacterium]|nr:hypothetical protein [Phycisphaerales bacterium]
LRARVLITAAMLAAVSLALAACGDSRDDSADHSPSVPRAIAGARTICTPGDRPGQLFTPRSVISDEGTLWIVDRTARIQQLDPATGECLQWFRMPEFELGKPTGIAIGPAPGESAGQRAIYVADTHYHRIMIYALPPTPKLSSPETVRNPATPIAPKLLGTIGSYGDGPSQFIYPCAVAILPTSDGQRVERIYVGEFGGNDRIQIFDRSLARVASIGTSGDGKSADPTKIELSRPQSLAIDPKRQSLWVADSINHRIGEFAFDGTLKRWIGNAGVEGSEPGQFRHPRSVVVMPDSSLLVVEFGNNRVQRLDGASGRSLGVWGKAGGRVGELAEPWSVAVIDGAAYVAEARNNRITVFILQ